MEALGSILLLLRDNPAATTGFIAGIVGAVLVDIVHWRWEVRRRKHPNGNGNGAKP